MLNNSDIRLVSLETGGNQAYIFATNKLRNIVGASELLYRVGTSYVERAIWETLQYACRDGKKHLVSHLKPSYCDDSLDKQMSDLITDKPIEADDEVLIEVVIATSGKAMLLVRGEDIARRFITAWSRIVTLEAPGLDAVAVISEHSVDPGIPLADKKHENSYLAAYSSTKERMGKLRAGGTMSALLRFQRLPIIAECAFSGMPAIGTKKVDEREYLVSASAKAQLDVMDDPQKSRETLLRLKSLFPTRRVLCEDIMRGLKALDCCSWLAVIHADGNGLGQMFINFDEYVKCATTNATGRDYIKSYRSFSSALDDISRQAFHDTVEEMFWSVNKDEIFKVIPVVVGGDDLTVVMDGRQGIRFAVGFMKKFCDLTKNDENVNNILKQTKGDERMPRLGMCAGISITKPHFPFSQSYHIAEGLMENAKLVKKKFGPDSIALDFHILYDSVATSISDIRERLKLDGGSRVITAKPYLVETADGAEEPMDGDEAWRAVHKYSDFLNAVYALMVNVDKNGLPSSQSHAVRESLFSEDIETQEAEWRILLAKKDYRGFADKWKFKNGDMDEQRSGLYIEAKDGPAGKNPVTRHFTYFLDALEAMKFVDNSDDNGGEHA